MTRPRASSAALLTLLSASYAVSFIDRALVSVAGAPIKADLQLTDVQFGALQGLAFALLYCSAGLPMGWLADRIDRRTLIAFGLLVWSAMTAVCGLATDYPVFFLARLGVGLGEACLLPAGMGLLASTIAPERMGQAVAIFLLGATAGNIVALVGGGWILTVLSAAANQHLARGPTLAPWRILFLLASALGIAIAPLVLRLRPSGPAVAQGRLSLLQSLRHLRRLAGAYGGLTAATACSLTLSQAQAAWAPQLFVRRFALPPGRAAVLIGLAVLLSAPLGQWTGGRVLDRLAAGRRAPAHQLLCACAALAVPPAVLFCTTGTLWLAVAGYGLFNAVVFAATPAGLWGWQRLAPEGARSLLIALLVSTVTLVGVGLGPFAVGFTTDHLLHDERALGPALLGLIVVAAAGGIASALAGRPAFIAALEARDHPAQPSRPALAPSGGAVTDEAREHPRQMALVRKSTG